MARKVNTLITSKVGEHLRKYYESKFLLNGFSLKGIDWPKKSDASLRYSLFCRALKGRKINSILDVGSGLGHFYSLLLKRQCFKARRLNYWGIDTNNALVIESRRRFPSAKFSHWPIEKGLGHFPSFDFVIANGLFTVKGGATNRDMKIFIHYCLDQMWKKSNAGIAFNLMTSYVDYKYKWLYYADPAEIINECASKFGRRFAVYQDTRLFDTVYVWLKDPAGLWDDKR